MKEVAEEVAVQLKSSSAATFTTWLSYCTGGGVTVAASLDWINQNAAALGVIIAFMTFCVNAHYRHKEHIIVLKNNDRRKQ